jgi:hypothetical protein
LPARARAELNGFAFATRGRSTLTARDRRWFHSRGDFFRERRMHRLAFVAFAIALAASPLPALADSNEYGSLDVVGPDTVRLVVGESSPSPFAVRLTDASGHPVAGYRIGFGTALYATPPEAPIQPLYGDYGSFAGDTSVITDADGIARAPAFTAGDVAGDYDLVALLFGQPSGLGHDILAAVAHVHQVGLASTVPITSAFTGTWYDPNQSGHGLILEVLSDQRMLAFWFTFDPTGNQAWFGDVGTIDGDVATIHAEAVHGGTWIPNFNAGNVSRSQWGDLVISFSDCDHGRVDFDTPYGYGAGHMDLTRLTMPAGVACDDPATNEAR